MIDKIAALQKIQLFADLPDEQIEWFAAQCVERAFESGEIVSKKGDVPQWMIVILAGEFNARDEDAPDDLIYVARAGDAKTEVTGKLPFSRMKKFETTSRSIGETVVLQFPVAKFPEMMQRAPQLVERLVWNLSDRVRETTRGDEQRDRLMSLGKLSAGLAHELNNPAAAARRASEELKCALENLREADLQLCLHEFQPAQRQALNDFENDCLKKIGTVEFKNALAQSDAEDELATWLEDHNVEEAWNIAPSLVEAGAGVACVEKLSDAIGDEILSAALERTAAQIVAARLVADISTSAGRISELVGAIKEYSYMDRAAVTEVDVARGLDNTLLILKHKIKQKNATVERDYASDLPKITATGGELNQMWTNLLDNAIDALPATNGKIKITARREPDLLFVEIRDNGAGIPDDVRNHIFDPFFTTKGVGEGTGLGLDTVQRIIHHHRGSIRVESKPGETCFQVRLPL